MGSCCCCFNRPGTTPFQIRNPFRRSTMQIGQQSTPKVQPKPTMYIDNLSTGESLESVVDWTGVVKKYRFLSGKVPLADDDEPDEQHKNGISFYIKAVPESNAETEQ